MCGIVGSVGISTDPVKAYSLMTNLLRETKRRGRHATGFYSVGLDGKPFFHKEGIASDLFIKRREWKENILGTKALIGHARFTTQGAATDNLNNHPHLSQNENIALVHNGIIFNYDDFKEDYKKSLVSNCDSELVLRIICREKDIVRGIKKVFKILGTGGDFACELIHRKEDGSAKFYFFRDDGRPGKLIDARKELGQYIFCSESDIWKDSVLKSGMSREIRQLPVVDIDPYTIVEVDAETLKSKLIKVDKPVKIRRTRITSAYHNSAYGYGGDWDEYGSYVGRHGRYNYQSTTAKNVDVDDLLESNTGGHTVLDEHWIETKNEKDLPRFIYDPDKNTSLKINPDPDDDDTQPIDVDSEELENTEYKRQLQKGLIDESERHPGWSEDALQYGIIDQDEYDALRDESPNALDHSSSFDLSDILPTEDELEDLGERLTGQDSDDDLFKNLGANII